MKRLVLTAVALSFIAAPVMQAQAAPIMTAPAATSANVVHVDWKKPARHDDRRYDNRKRDNRWHVERKVEEKKVQKRHWKRGQRYSDWRRHQPVRDYHRHGLKRPNPGQEWIRVGNDYLLVGIASGIIGAMIAAR